MQGKQLIYIKYAAGKIKLVTIFLSYHIFLKVLLTLNFHQMLHINVKFLAD